MGRRWTPDEKAKQSSRAAKLWADRVSKNPDAHPLAQARAERALTQKDLSELSGVAKATISSIENGCRRGAFGQPVYEKLYRVLAVEL
jgi:DNA-binding XRE family transcriptional regulator